MNRITKYIPLIVVLLLATYMNTAKARSPDESAAQIEQDNILTTTDGGLYMNFVTLAPYVYLAMRVNSIGTLPDSVKYQGDGTYKQGDHTIAVYHLALIQLEQMLITDDPQPILYDCDTGISTGGGLLTVYNYISDRSYILGKWGEAACVTNEALPEPYVGRNGRHVR
jgi:hypothetical protein